MKILIFGASGLLGYSVTEVAIRRKWKTIGLYSKNPVELPGLYSSKPANIYDEELLQRLVFDEWPDVIVNAAAISEPDKVDAEPENALKVNVEFPKKLAQLSNHIGAKLIHISTDMVFDGEAPEYRSTSVPNPLTTYGQQKLLAEKQVLKHGGTRVVVLRSTIINGNSMTGRRSLHEQLLRAVMDGRSIKLFTDEFRQPCHASNLAEVIIELAEREELHGIFHWGGNELVSRYEMGIRILNRFQLPTDTITKTSHSDLPEGIKRPACLRFVLDPLQSKIKTKAQNFQEQLEELHLPWDLYQWFRKNSKDPDCYVFRVKVSS